MINSQIATVLEALGEKIENTKSALNYEEWRATELEKENVKLKEEYAALKDAHAILEEKYEALVDKLNEYIARGQQ